MVFNTIVPYKARGGFVETVQRRLDQNQPDNNFTPREYIKFAGDYIYAK